MRATRFARAAAAAALAAAALPAAANATWSGSSGRVAWKTDTSIRFAQRDGGGARTLGASSLGGLQWSPGGRRIAYAGDGVQTMRADGTRRHVVVSQERLGGDFDVQPAWSPSGRRIAFSVMRPNVDEGAGTSGESWRIYVVGRNGKRLRKVARGHHPVWSGSGRQLFYAQEDGDIARIGPNGKGRRVLARQRGHVTSLDLSPDGRRLAWRIDRHPRGQRALPPKVRTVNLRTGRRTGFTSDTGRGVNAADVVWTPSGQRLAYLHAEPRRPYEVRTVRPSGSGIRTLFALPPDDLATGLDWQTTR